MQPRLSRTFGCKYKAAKHTLLDPVMSPRPPPPHSLRLEFPVDGPVQTPTYGKVTLKMCTTQRKRNCRIPTPTKGILMLYQSKLRSCSALCACFSFLVLNLGCCEEEKKQTQKALRVIKMQQITFHSLFQSLQNAKYN